MTAPSRNVTSAPGVPESTAADWESISGRDDPGQRFQIRVLCTCTLCEGSGKVDRERCPECRGEGRTALLLATAGTPAAVGEALVALGREGEFEDCPVGILDVGEDAEPGKRWILKPWTPSPRNVSDAGRVLRTARR